MNKNQIRQNKATKEWVVYSPKRGKRPHDYKNESRQRNLPEHDKNCPFCPGNENGLGEIILAKGSNKKYGWQTRVIPNKYPALIPGGNTERSEIDKFYIKMSSYGRHEVIIESPYHNRDIALMNENEIGAIIETYHKRYLVLMKEHTNMIPIIFRNHGKRAGSSLIHPHSQLIVTGFVPGHIRKRESEAQHYHDEWGRCVFCDIIENELRENKRIILYTDTMISFIPFAAEVPFETWIIPRQHKADFGTINENEKNDLAKSLHNILSRLYQKLDDPDYNFIINTSARYEKDVPHLHWYLQIRPRLTTLAGFEIGSGIPINPSIPEEDAEYLKGD